jgi:GNAT superfamily N-acetyltransferase
MSSPLPASPIPSLAVIELTAEHEPLLQRLFEANPDYFLTVQGEPARPDEAFQEIHDSPPADIPFTRQWVIGYQRADGALIAVTSVVADIFAEKVWLIGLFLIDTSRRGSGDAQALYRSIEEWVIAQGGHWLRLGVVIGNQRAERFWASRGFVETRIREGYRIGDQLNRLRVMAKPLAGGTLDEYLALVARDRPE